jgi:dienelactone hydrolase
MDWIGNRSSRISTWTQALIAGLCLISSLSDAIALNNPQVSNPQPVRVEFPSLDRHPDGSAVSIIGHWFSRTGAFNAENSSPDGASRGAVLLLHGCGGPYNPRGALSVRMREYTDLLQSRGLDVLVTDSLTGRGEKELCTQRIGQRRIDQGNRRADAWAALQWIAAQPGIDPHRIAVIGWSHGGSTVLSALDLRQPLWARVGIVPAAAVAFYPGCSEALRQQSQPASPLLLMIGSADDWTPARPCEQWVLALKSRPGPADRATDSTAPVDLRVYQGAFHNFDGTAPIRIRTDVPNGIRPGAGVTTGGDPAARADARQRMLDLLVRTGVIR